MEGVYRLRLKVSNGKATDIDEYELFATYKNDGEFFDAEDAFPPPRAEGEEPGIGGAGECQYVDEYDSLVFEPNA